MSAVVAQIPIGTLASAPKALAEEILVGKDILELLTGAMYVDPLNVFREYIQNAADAVDEAREAELEMPEGPEVVITFDQAKRSVLIRDFGISVGPKDYVRVLTAIGGSRKRGSQLRGFRGVGRLSGLGYCQEVVFRGRAQGAKKVFELSWDGRALKAKLREASFEGGLQELVRAIVEHREIPSEGFPERFFEVELRNVTRQKNGVILNEDAVRDYLAQVAPVGFNPDSKCGKEIAAKLAESGIATPLSIQIAGAIDPVYHPLADKISTAGGQQDKIRDIAYLDIKGSDGETCAVGWLANHAYVGALPKATGLGGLRLRVGNVQVGNSSLAANLFHEPRFCAWTVGEIHIVSPKIVPNGRRDDFEPTPAYAHLEGELQMVAKRISDVIRERSKQRNRFRTVESNLTAAQSWVDSVPDEIPGVIAPLVREIALERIALAEKEALRLPLETGEQAMAMKQIAVARTTVEAVSSRPGRTPASMSGEVREPVLIALKTILQNSKLPADGVSLAVKVYDAIKEAN